jgi:hypothetical protein
MTGRGLQIASILSSHYQLLLLFRPQNLQYLRNLRQQYLGTGNMMVQCKCLLMSKLTESQVESCGICQAVALTHLQIEKNLSFLVSMFEPDMWTCWLLGQKCQREAPSHCNFEFKRIWLMEVCKGSSTLSHCFNGCEAYSAHTINLLFSNR